MNRHLSAFLFAGLLVPCAVGCASRAAPFDDMDQAQITVLRLQGVEPPPVVAPPVAAVPGIPGLAIPGLSPEQQAQLNAAGQGLLQGATTLIPGLGNLLPGAGGAAPAPVVQEQPRFKGFVILAQMPLNNDTIKDDLLDIFGDEDSFQAGSNPSCMTPGMGVSMARPNAAPVELLISFSCQRAVGDGFAWPHKADGFTPDTAQKLNSIYQQLWMQPVPPSGA